MTTFREVLLGEEYKFSLDHEPRVIVDAGANIGLASIWFAIRYPNARIIALEAERTNFELMVRNVALFPNVTPLHAALWSHRGVLGIDDPQGEGVWAFQTTELREGHDSYGVVDSITIQDLLSDYAIDRIDLLKIDIEGAECEVFSDPGSLHWIDSVDAIAIELHDRFRPGCSRAFYSRVNDLTVEETRGMNTFVARSSPQAK
jgi:FkbM family methyltransferase